MFTYEIIFFIKAYSTIFDIDDIGRKFYIILKGSVAIMQPVN